MPFSVAYEARIQVSRLSSTEKAELDRLFSESRPKAASVPTPDPEQHFVSRLGAKRVLWRMGERGIPEILSVLDRSYAT